MQPQNQQSNYDFILNPNQSHRATKMSLNGANMPIKIGVAAAGAIVLLIIIMIAKSLFSSAPALAPVFLVAQDQQAILHLVQGSQQSAQNNQTDFGESVDDFNATADAALTSLQAQLLKYLSNNNYKYNPAALTARINSQYDSQLTSAAQSGTYATTYTTIMNQVLNAYSQDINTAYGKLPAGSNGQKLLKSNYDSAQLFKKQLSSGD